MVSRRLDEPTASRTQKALVHLASIDPIELCNEAKVERCRATRDLRCCGRNVQRVLIPCNHAALCEECSQRCEVCPICRLALPKGGNVLPLRLYYECIEAGLISKRRDDRLRDKEDDTDIQLDADVQRLYSLFDVALENNLVSLVCHYVTDVCMDETAVSSDPVIAFLLDEKVVKDWCRRTFETTLKELNEIYSLTESEMPQNLSSLLKISSKLAGISNVLDVLESSFKGSISAMLQDLHHLQESILKTKQEACRLLPEIAGPYIHPKVAHALLERQNPDAGLMALRWSRQDGGATLVSLGEAITAVQVRVECGLLTEAFKYQRMICTKLKDKKLNDADNEVNERLNNWQIWLKILVSEICCLCIKRSIVDRIIELPWNADEEKHLHKCLFDVAKTDPSSSVGSLLVVFYLRRYRYVEAYQVDSKLQKLEEDFI